LSALPLITPLPLTQAFVGEYIQKKGKIHHLNVGIYASRNVCLKDIGSWASMVLLNYQNVIEMTSNIIYIVALGGGFKCPHKIHLNTQCWGLIWVPNFGPHAGNFPDTKMTT
jgi:hypothetical protein